MEGSLLLILVHVDLCRIQYMQALLFGIPHTHRLVAMYSINGAAGRISNRMFTVVHCGTRTLQTFEIWICRIKYALLFRTLHTGGCSNIPHMMNSSCFRCLKSAPDQTRLSVSCEDKQHSNFTHSWLNIHLQSRYWQLVPSSSHSEQLLHVALGSYTFTLSQQLYFTQLYLHSCILTKLYLTQLLMHSTSYHYSGHMSTTSQSQHCSLMKLKQTSAEQGLRHSIS